MWSRKATEGNVSGKVKAGRNTLRRERTPPPIIATREWKVKGGGGDVI